RGGSGWRARMARFMDTLRFQWTKWVIEYDLVAQLQLFRDMGSAIKSGAVSLKDLVVRHVWLLASLAAAIASVVYVRRRRRRDADPRSPTARARPRSRSAIAAAYHRVAKQLAKHGLARPPGVTPREHAARLANPFAAQLRELTDLYYAAEWGGRADPAAERRATELAGAIVSALATR
ncbi:MAG: DUF4129 domain-containing protein, partial [Kofleriaceae bacterium]